eukprot:c11001_g1_i1.p1 GENE.c11001_g1_i1~~c11001_g1_i1.p1  ORF type:complete len:529 (+),score=112.35 c11001_g1_i1:50-1588(+)
MSFWSTAQPKDEWRHIQLDNFPKQVDHNAFYHMMQSLSKEMEQSVPLSNTDAQTQELLNSVFQLVDASEARRDIIEDCKAMAWAEHRKQKEQARAAATANFAIAGQNDTVKPQESKGLFLTGFLATRSKIFKKLTWNYFVLTAKNLLQFESEEHFVTGASHLSIVPLNNKCRVLNQTSTAQNEPCVCLNVDGSERHLIAFSAHEANMWRTCIAARLAQANLVQNQSSLSTQHIHAISTAFRAPIHTLTVVDMSGIPMNKQLLGSVVCLLQSLTAVHTVVLDSCSIADDLIESQTPLIEFLHSTSLIQTVSLRSNMITATGAVALSKMFHPRSHITALHVDGNPLGNGIQSLLLSLPLQPISLSTLTAATTNMELLGLNAVCRTKDAQDNTITTTTASSSNVAHVPCLEWLDLSDNLLGDEGFNVLASFVGKLGIRKLSVHNCGASVEGTKSLVSKCTTTKIQSLDTSHNGHNLSSLKSTVTFIQVPQFFWGFFVALKPNSPLCCLYERAARP